MKRLLILFCVLLLTLPLSAHAQTEFAAVCNNRPLLSLQYDETAYSLDTESYLASSIGGHTWLGMLYSRAVTVELAADLYPDLPALCTPEQLSDFLCAHLVADQCAPLEIYTTPGLIPFAILSLNGVTGPSYYAAVISQGYVVYFELYNLLGGAVPQDLDTLKLLLDTVVML